MPKFKDLTTQKKVDFAARYDFNGSTGFHIYSRLKKSQRKYHNQIARHVIRLYRQGGEI